MASFRFVLLALLFSFVAGHAEAAPFVNIRALVSVGASWWYPAPEGISIGCYGDATGTDGCTLSAALSETVATSTTLTVSATGGLVITNTTDHVIDDWLSLTTNESAFNPGGPAVGISIDDPLTQGARFSSGVGGMGAGDSHSCSVGVFGYAGTIFSPTACGVGSPDSSQGSFSVNLSDLDPHGQMFLPYGVSITAEFLLPPSAEVPTPASLLIVLAGLAGLTVMRRRVISPRGS